MKYIQTDNAPAPAGHYSQGVVHGGLVFVAGMLPITPDGDMITGPMAEQTAQVLANVEAVLLAAGSDRSHVLKVTVYVADIDHWGEVNRVFGDFFGDHKPARAVVPTRDLHFGLGIEVEVVAAVKE